MIIKNFSAINIRPPIAISIIAGLLTIYSCSLFTEEIVPDSSKELLEEGTKAIKLDQNLRAKTIFTQLIEDFPDSKERSQALLLLARTHYSSEEYEEAKFHFQKFIDLHPKHKPEPLHHPVPAEVFGTLPPLKHLLLVQIYYTILPA